MQIGRMLANPQAALNQLISSNPEYAKIYDVARSYGGDFQKAFYEMAKEKGVNPNDILNMMK